MIIDWRFHEIAKTYKDAENKLEVVRRHIERYWQPHKVELQIRRNPQHSDNDYPFEIWYRVGGNI